VSGRSVSRAAEWADDRLSLARLGRGYLRKVFPEHWSFMLGEIALWSFVVLLVTGTFLTFWFTPSMSESTYQGSYAQLRGVPMSDAYASTLHLSFDVRGGLLLRQMHHWAAMVFIAAMFVHMMRVFVTGAFRKPREVSWLIGATMLLLGILEGFLGYSLPDDLLSGTGLRIADGLIKATPVAGTYLSFLLFGGEFPGDAVIPRFYVLHVLFLPGILLALVGLHVTLVFVQKHTQWPGPGRTEKNVVGYPLLPVYVAKTTGFFFMVFGVTALMGGLLSINPVWKYGPYDPSKVTAGSQPDWYMAIAEGLLRIMPGWETHVAGHTVSWNVLLPGQVLPFVLFGMIVCWPFLEAWVTGDRREHHLLHRPRDAPTRTAFLAAMVCVYGLLWIAGGNDILATQLHLSLNQITYLMRAAVLVVPVVVFLVARAWCLGLQRADRRQLLEGRETGVVVRSADGGYTGRHAPLEVGRAFTLTARDLPGVTAPEPETNGRGVPRSGRWRRRVRRRLSRALYGDSIATPTAEELDGASCDTGERPALTGRGRVGS
jgi:ubiquinol-cytochrome c reductase cytochrome b subunit